MCYPALCDIEFHMLYAIVANTVVLSQSLLQFVHILKSLSIIRVLSKSFLRYGIHACTLFKWGLTIAL